MFIILNYLYDQNIMQTPIAQYTTDLERYTSEFEILPDNFTPEYPSPIDKIKVGKDNVWIKHEDLLSLGCAKERSIVYMIAKYLEMGRTMFTVSSSGNAALVAAYIGMHANTEIEEIQVLLSDKISDSKLERIITFLGLEDEVSIEDFREGLSFEKVTFTFCENPKQVAFQLEKQGYVNLRGSTDDLATIGFKTISYEISKQLEETLPDAIFIPASSGTTVVGIYEGFKDLGWNPEIHVVQTTKAYALVKKIKNIHFPVEPEHPAESIIDVIGHRRKQIEEIITNSRGNGWVITAEECISAKKELFRQYNITAGYDSALTYAAYLKSVQEKKYKNPVLVFTG